MMAKTKEYQKAWRDKNREKIREYHREYKRRCRESEDFRELERIRSAAFRLNNPATAKAAWEKWHKENPEKGAAKGAKRRASVLQRTVKWADERLIRALYAEAAQLTIETGVLHHVDHIIPLQAELCSGLHVHNNLQILLAQDNLAKGNRYTPETWRENETTEPAPRLTRAEADVLYELTTRGRLTP